MHMLKTALFEFHSDELSPNFTSNIEQIFVNQLMSISREIIIKP